MQIQNITITNYLCYYEKNKCELSPGLNLILGDNGDGKTKFFESVIWLLYGAPQHTLLDLASEKAKHQLDVGSRFRVSVSIKAQQFDDIKRVERYFEVERQSNGSLSVYKSGLDGVLEDGTGRTPVNGQTLLDQLFPSEFRKYLMFKGETSLNIFDNPEALDILIKSFSQGKYFRKYSDFGALILKKAEQAVDESSKNDRKNATELKRVKANIEKEFRLINQDQDELEELKSAKDKTEQYRSEAAAYVDNAQSVKTFNERIDNIKSQISRQTSQLKQDYTTYLFDDKWLLNRFAPLQKEYVEKVEGLERQKRNQDRAFTLELGKKKEREESIINSKIIPLPIEVPSERYAQEMIDACLCKVCNRPAEVGSDAYNYMVQRLESYREQRKNPIIEVDEEKLFKNNFLKRLLILSTNQQDSGNIFEKISQEIKNTFEFNDARKNDITKLESDLIKEENERNKVISASDLASEKLNTVLGNYNNWVQDISRYESKIVRLEDSLERKRKNLKELIIQKDKYDRESVETFLIQTRDVIKDVEAIFKDSERRIYTEFVEDLQQKSNIIFNKINVNSFIGKIIFNIKERKKQPEIEIKLVDDSGRRFSANQSLLTTMHMSVLFAISDLANESATEPFPMFFDAPTSSFGETKTKEFLNIVSETDQQRIVLFYDFVAKDDKGRSIVKEEFHEVKRGKAYLLQLERPFDRQKLETINTQIEEI